MTWRRTAATAVVISLLASGVLLVRWDRARQVERAAMVASADAAAAVSRTDPLIEQLRLVRDTVADCLAAIRTSTGETLGIIAAARERLRRRIAARRAAEQRAKRREAQQRASGGLLIGDSVSLGAERCLEPLGYDLDSEVGRQFTTGLERLRSHAASGLPDTVVVHLGTNGPFGADGFTEVMELTGSQRRVVWVTIALPDLSRYSFADEQNELIRSMAARYDNARVADWAAAADENTDWTADGIHLTSSGCEGFADVVDAAVRAS